MDGISRLVIPNGRRRGANFFLGDIISYEKILLPPLGDPALWWEFRNPTVKLNQSRYAVDEWGSYEQRGDKVASLVFFHLTDKYNLSFGWANTLHEIFTLNEYWLRIGPALDLPDLSQFKSTIMADALEVLVLLIQSLTFGIFRSAQ